MLCISAMNSIGGVCRKHVRLRLAFFNWAMGHLGLAIVEALVESSVGIEFEVN